MQYDAFISYSHAADGKLAPAVQRGLQLLAKPWYRLRNLRVFRDESNLSATPSLWTDIESALSDARFFVLFASHESAVSPWVKKEIEFWKNNKSLEHLLIIRTSGELNWDSKKCDFDWNRTNAVPQLLSGCFKDEPLYIDLSWANNADDVSLRNPRFRTDVARLSAPIHGRSLDELVGEDVRQHRRTLRFVSVVIVTLLLLLLFAVSGGYFAYLQKLEAEKQSRQAFARELAMRSKSLAKDAPETALQLAKQAVLSTFQVDHEVVPEAESVLYELLSNDSARGKLILPKSVERGWEWIWSAQFNSDGSRIGVVGLNGAGLWDAELSLKGFSPEEALSLSFSKDGQQLAVAERSGGVLIFDASGEIIQKFESHNQRAITISFLKDGERLVVTGCDEGDEYHKCKDGPAKIWQKDHRLLATLHPNHGWITAACTDPEGKYIVTVTEDGLGMLWTVNGKLLKEFNAEANWVPSNCFSLNGQQFVTGGCPAYQRPNRGMGRGAFHAKCLPEGGLWSIKGRRIAKFTRNGKATVTDVQYVGNQGRILIRYNDGKIELRNSEGRATKLLGEHESVMASTTDGANFISVNESGKGSVWNQNGQRLGQFSAHPADYIEAAVDPLQPQVLTISCERNRQGHCLRGSARLRSIQGPLVGKLTGHHGGVRKAFFNHDGTQIMTIDGKGDARIWSRNGTLIARFSSKHGAIRDGIFHDKQIITLVCRQGKRNNDCQNGLLSSWTTSRDPKEKLFLGDGRLISMKGHQTEHYILSVGCSSSKTIQQSSCFQNSVVYLSDLSIGKNYLLNTTRGSVVWAGFGKDANSIVIVTCTSSKDFACLSSKVSEWDLHGQKISEIPGDLGGVKSVAYDMTLNRLLLVLKENSSTLWDLDTRSLIHTFDGTSRGHDVVEMDRGSVLLTSYGKIELWRENPELYKIMTILRHGQTGMTIPRISPTGSRIVAIGCQEPTSSAGLCRREGLWMWDSEGTFIAVLQTPSQDHKLAISTFAFGPKGERLATGQSSGRVQLWGKQGNHLATFETQQGSITSLEFSPDGNLLLVGGADGDVQLWKLWGGILKMLSEAQRRVINDMSDEECRRYLHRDTCPAFETGLTKESIATSVKFVGEYFKTLEKKNVSKAISMWEADEKKVNLLKQSISNAEWYRLRRTELLSESGEEAEVLVELVSKEKRMHPQSWRIKVSLINHNKNWRITGMSPVR